jgi:hypothetical protein
MTVDSTAVMIEEVAVVGASMAHVVEAAIDVIEEAMIAVETVGGVRREAKNN